MLELIEILHNKGSITNEEYQLLRSAAAQDQEQTEVTQAELKQEGNESTGELARMHRVNSSPLVFAMTGAIGVDGGIARANLNVLHAMRSVALRVTQMYRSEMTVTTTIMLIASAAPMGQLFTLPKWA